MATMLRNAAGSVSPASSATRPPIEMPTSAGGSGSSRASSMTGRANNAGVSARFGAGL